MSKVSQEQLRLVAKTAMANYISELAEKVPAGTKAAELQRNSAALTRLQKLAQEVRKNGDVFGAVATVFADKSAAYRHQVVQGLVSGLRQKLASKQAGMGDTKHPSAAVTGNVAGASRATVSPKSKSFSAGC